MLTVSVAFALGLAFAPPCDLALRARPALAMRSRRSPAPIAQQGPLEEGFKELLPLATESGDVDPELVRRMDAEVFELTGVGLEDLLNPSKVVNLERERVLLEEQLKAPSLDGGEREALQKKLEKAQGQLYSEKRTVFKGWLKGVFVGQSLIAIGLSGLAAFDAFPGFDHLDLSIRALGFWSYWLFIIPSLRARRPRGWEKKALNIAFLGSPILTIALPFVTKEPQLIWGANLALLIAAYGFGFATGRGEDAKEAESFTGALRWLDFGSGQERGIRGAARERLFSEKEAAAASEREPAAVEEE